jgi:class 3 adenylate cyclase
MNRWVEMITEAGVDDALPRREARHVRVLNALAVMLALQSLAYVPLFALFAPTTVPLIVIDVPAMISWALLPLVNARRQYALARAIALVTALFQVGGIAALVGRDALVHFYFVGGIGFAAAIFPHTRRLGMFVYMGAVSLAFFAVELFVPQPLLTDVSASLVAILHASIIVGIVLFVGLVAVHGNREIVRADDELAAALGNSERLLLNILPQPVAERLKAGQAIADAVPSATILFADIVGFTTLSQTVAPDALVAMLDDIFSAFDQLLARFGLEKIKTIGDAYMAAAGIPEPRPDHAERAASMALAMQDEMKARFPALELRIGLHAGPIVAGVIGKTKFAYDVWGDTVNTASRMESHGTPGKIQVTRALKDALTDRFTFEERGMQDVKGKGKMELFFLVGRR